MTVAVGQSMTAARPEPGDKQTLLELIATELAERLDRDHQLWQCTVVEQRANDRWSLIVRAHYSLVDAVSGVFLRESFCDPRFAFTRMRRVSWCEPFPVVRSCSAASSCSG
ncbi:wax ester/triacylglycerol synthase domain-containing protein [Nocardia anaemiae]|uniref:wax ester/triacylglycerol synthase domain-containing protein n=1 Tax=Nocardia anaemiae TaxID=263910 RepID=UPI0007A4B634